MLDQITPVILTYNEADNIGRTLERLAWAKDIVIVDSLSTDETVAIAQKHKQVRLFQREFGSHAQQWSYAISETGIETDWVLALDADYILPGEFSKELARLTADADADGYSAAFRYCVWGKPLRGTLYPSVTVLFRRAKAHYVQEGHTQRVQVQGRVVNLRSKILHDDRKPLSRWLAAQDRYMRLEAEEIGGRKSSALGLPDKLRKLTVFSPFLVFAYCYFIKGCWLDGRAGFYYATQRMLAESLLSLRLMERKREG